MVSYQPSTTWIDDEYNSKNSLDHAKKETDSNEDLNDVLAKLFHFEEPDILLPDNEIDLLNSNKTLDYNSKCSATDNQQEDFDIDVLDAVFTDSSVAVDSLMWDHIGDDSPFDIGKVRPNNKESLIEVNTKKAKAIQYLRKLEKEWKKLLLASKGAESATLDLSLQSRLLELDHTLKLLQKESTTSAQPFMNQETVEINESVNIIEIIHTKCGYYHSFMKELNKRNLTKKVASARSHVPKSSQKRKRAHLSKDAKCILKTWLNDHFSHPYPTEDEKYCLASLCNITVEQVCNWFINTRVREWKPQVAEILAKSSDDRIFDENCTIRDSSSINRTS